MNFPLKPVEDQNVARHLATSRQNLNNGWGSHTFFGTPKGGNSQLTFNSYMLNNNNTPNYYPDDHNVYYGTLTNNKRRSKKVSFNDFTKGKRKSYGNPGAAKSFSNISYSSQRAPNLLETALKKQSDLKSWQNLIKGGYRMSEAEARAYGNLVGDEYAYQRFLKEHLTNTIDDPRQRLFQYHQRMYESPEYSAPIVY